jgi:hypothetical protein
LLLLRNGRCLWALSKCTEAQVRWGQDGDKNEAQVRNKAQSENEETSDEKCDTVCRHLAQNIALGQSDYFSKHQHIE